MKLPSDISGGAAADRDRRIFGVGVCVRMPLPSNFARWPEPMRRRYLEGLARWSEPVSG